MNIFNIINGLTFFFNLFVAVVFIILGYNFDFVQSIIYCILIVSGFYFGKFFAYKRVEKERNERLLKHKTAYRNYDNVKGLRDTLRRIIFTYAREKKKTDFLLDIKVDGEVIMQVLHLRHFPEFQEDILDVEFGMWLHIPIFELPQKTVDKLTQMAGDDYKTWVKKQGPAAFFAISLGSRVDIAGYIISNILREVFGVDEDKRVSFLLYDRDEIPYSNSPSTREIE